MNLHEYNSYNIGQPYHHASLNSIYSNLNSLKCCAYTIFYFVMAFISLNPSVHVDQNNFSAI